MKGKYWVLFLSIIILGTTILYFMDLLPLNGNEDQGTGTETNTESTSENESFSYVKVNYTIHNLTVNDFAYLLQYDSFGSVENAVDNLSSQKYDLLVLDSFAYLPDREAWTIDDLNKIRAEPNPKILLCYISIGEAESYRYYWNESWDANGDGIPDEGAPEWLGVENPDWEGNYKVKYWMEGWQSIIYGSPDAYIDRILSQGFDGIYLDIIDAYEYYEEQGIDNAAQLMIDFVKNISLYAKTINPDFLIVPQNGEALVQRNSSYLSYIDGIGREDVLYNGDERNPDSVVSSTDDILSQYVDAGKFVLEIEYPTETSAIEECYLHASNHGYLCYVGPRDLASILIHPGFEPD